MVKILTSKERHEKRYLRRKAKRDLKKRNIVNKSYDEVYSFENLYRASKECCKGVRWKTSVQNFENELLIRSFELKKKMDANAYKFHGFCFFKTNEHGKIRDIHALNIEDRAVQKCFCNEIMTEAYSKSFVSTNSASLKNKGIHFAIQMLKKQLRHHYRKYGCKGGIYQYDFSKYFASIPHKGAKMELRKYIKDRQLIALGDKFIDEFLTLHDSKGPFGVGLGSPISQNIALDYANLIDHYIKDVFRIKGYGRYMDDGYVISNSFEELKEIKNFVEILANSVGIKINEKKNRITPFKHHSFTFLKIRFTLTDSGKIVTKLNKDSLKRIRRKLKIFKRWADEGRMSIDDICVTYQCWRGYAKHFGCYRTIYNMDKKFVSTFIQYLSQQSKPFKCYIKYVWNDYCGWVYYCSKKQLKIFLDLQSKKIESMMYNGFVPLCERKDYLAKMKSKPMDIFDKIHDILNEPQIRKE